MSIDWTDPEQRAAAERSTREASRLVAEALHDYPASGEVDPEVEAAMRDSQSKLDLLLLALQDPNLAMLAPPEEDQP